MARELMDLHGLKDWKLEWNMSESHLGICYSQKKLIQLSLIWTKEHSELEVRDTVLHESSHGINWIRNRGSGHGEDWQAICREIGAKPNRTYCGPQLAKNFELYNKDTGVVYQTYREFPVWGTKVFTSFLPGRPDTKGKLRIRRVDKMGG